MYKNYSDIGAQQDGQYDQYSVKEIEDENDKNKLLLENRVLCVDVYADWCQPCKYIAPDYAFLATKYTGKGIALVKEKIDKKLSDVDVIPTFDFYVDGKLLIEHRLVGGDISAVEKKIKELIELANTHSKETQTKGPQFSRSSIRSRSSMYSPPNGIETRAGDSGKNLPAYSPYQQYNY